MKSENDFIEKAEKMVFLFSSVYFGIFSDFYVEGLFGEIIISARFKTYQH